MLKLIQFTDVRAVWATEEIAVPGCICRTIDLFDLLPGENFLTFNCKEIELASLLHSPAKFHSFVEQYYIPELKLIKNNEKICHC
jgi:hypothetical protein